MPPGSKDLLNLRTLKALNSPIRHHLVDTIAGPRHRLSLDDFGLDATPGSIADYLFLGDNDILLADSPANRVFRVGPDGLFRTFAGTGVAAHSGDAGSALEAGIPGPFALAASAAGVVYVSQQDGRIRRIAPDGTISTIAGNGEQGCPVTNDVAVSSALSPASAMAVDLEGNLFVASRGCTIIRIDAAGIVTTVAGMESGVGSMPLPDGVTQGFPALFRSVSAPSDLAVSNSGDLIYSSGMSIERRLFRVTPAGLGHVLSQGGSVGTLREGDFRSVRLSEIRSLALRNDGSILVASSNDTPFGAEGHELGLVTPDGSYSILFTRDGFGGKPRGEIAGAFAAPGRIRFNASGQAHILDRFLNAILRVNPDGSLQRVFGRFDPPPTLQAGSVEVPWRDLTPLAVDATGRIFFRTSQRLFRRDLDGSIHHIAGNGDASSAATDVSALETGVGSVSDFRVDAAGNLYLLETFGTQFGPSGIVRQIGSDGVIRVVAGGGLIGGGWEGLPATEVDLGRPVTNLAVSADGIVYFAERRFSNDFRVWKRDLDGKLTRVFGTLEPGLVLPPAEGVVARDVTTGTVNGLNALFLEPDGSLVLQFGGWSDRGIFRIDAGGLLQTIVNLHQGVAFTDGAPTINARTFFMEPGLSISNGRFLASLIGVGLVEYVDGGNVRLWASSTEGELRADGNTVAGNASPSFARLQLLPDGGLVWIVANHPSVAFRRSVPVPAGCVYSVNASNLSVPAEGAALDLMLTAGPDCPWVLGASSYWLQWQGDTRGSGPVNVRIAVAANPSPDARAGFVYLAGRRVDIQQAGNPGAGLFELSPREVTVAPSGGDVKIDVFASAGTAWQFALPAGVSVDGSATGNGSGYRILSIPANGATAPRVITVSVNGIPVHIRQLAAVTMVPVTITGNDPTAKVFVDFVERPLPFTTQWVAGSSHHLFVREWDKITDFSLRQFVGWESDSGIERLVTVPVNGVAYEVRYRLLHGLSLNPSRVSGDVLSPGAVPGKPSVSVPYSVRSSLNMFPLDFYPAEENLELLGIPNPGFRFTDWQIAPWGSASNVQAGELTANPASIPVTGPMIVTARFQAGDTLPRPLIAGLVPSHESQGTVSTANPAPVAVAARAPGGTPSVTGVFVANASETFRDVDWLKVRLPSTNAAPLVVELKAETADPAFQVPAPFSLAGAAYLLTAEGQPEPIYFTHSVTSQVNGIEPRITALTDAGGFRQGAGSDNLPAAPDTILTIFGENLADQAAFAQSIPLPTSLGGVRVEYLRPSTQSWEALPLFFASPSQINFHLPSLGELLQGPTSIPIQIDRGGILSVQRLLQVKTLSASLFTADSSGLGAAAGFYVRVRPDGSQERGNLFQCEQSTCMPNPVPRGANNRIFLELYGTGFSHLDLELQADSVLVLLNGRPLPAAFVGPNGEFVGLSQLNVEVPADMPSGVDLDLYLLVRPQPGAHWLSSNRLTIHLQ